MKLTVFLLAVSATMTQTFLALGLATLLHRLEHRDDHEPERCARRSASVDPETILRSRLFRSCDALPSRPIAPVEPLYVQNTLMSDQALAALGLAEGDVLLLIQGQPVTEELMRELPRWSRSLHTIELTIVRPRDGILTLEIPVSALRTPPSLPAPRSRSVRRAHARGCGLGSAR